MLQPQQQLIEVAGEALLVHRKPIRTNSLDIYRLMIGTSSASSASPSRNTEQMDTTCAPAVETHLQQDRLAQCATQSTSGSTTHGRTRQKAAYSPTAAGHRGDQG